MAYTEVCYFSLSVQAYRPKFVQRRKFTPFCSRYILISYLVSHNTSCEIDQEHNVVDFVSRITYLAVPGVIFSAYHTWSITPTIFIHEIYRRLLFFTLGRFVSAWITSCGWFRITYLAVPGIHFTSREIDHEHHVVDFVSHTWYLAVPGIIFSAYHTVQFFRLQKITRKIAYCCIRRCSLALSTSSAVSAFPLLLLLLLLFHVPFTLPQTDVGKV